MEKYILKDALIAKIEDWRDKIKKGIFSIPLTGSDRANATFEYEILGKVKDLIDTIEVKAKNFGSYSHLDSIKYTADRMTSGNFMHNRAAIKFSANTIAKVLELIGLKAQKGE